MCCPEHHKAQLWNWPVGTSYAYSIVLEETGISQLDAYSSHALQEGDYTRARNAVERHTKGKKNIKQEKKKVEERRGNETQEEGGEVFGPGIAD